MRAQGSQKRHQILHPYLSTAMAMPPKWAPCGETEGIREAEGHLLLPAGSPNVAEKQGTWMRALRAKDRLGNTWYSSWQMMLGQGQQVG